MNSNRKDTQFINKIGICILYSVLWFVVSQFVVWNVLPFFKSGQLHFDYWILFHIHRKIMRLWYSSCQSVYGLGTSWINWLENLRNKNLNRISKKRSISIYIQNKRKRKKNKGAESTRATFEILQLLHYSGEWKQILVVNYSKQIDKKWKFDWYNLLGRKYYVAAACSNQYSDRFRFPKDVFRWVNCWHTQKW